jgi:aryl-alcohol dehydrogenase-like predicted oxidoreductase
MVVVTSRVRALGVIGLNGKDSLTNNDLNILKRRLNSMSQKSSALENKKDFNMKTRRLGTTDLYLSAIGIGTWPMGGPGRIGWGPQDDKDSITSIRRGLERGINWIDTAPNYGLGHSEEVVGMAIKGISPKPIIATKCLFMWKPDGTQVMRLDRERVRIQCENSLKRLDIDAIDMYMIHAPNPIEYVEEAWETFIDLKKEGKVRWIGVSRFSIEQMELIKTIHPIAFLEPPYSMLEREAEERLLDYCQKNDIGVVVYSPLQQGLLTGAIKSIDDLAPDDLRRRNPHFKEPEFSANLNLARELVPIASKYGRSVAQLAIAWVLRRPEVTSAITGPRVPTEIEDTIKAGGWELIKEDIAAIEKLLAKRQEALNSARK